MTRIIPSMKIAQHAYSENKRDSSAPFGNSPSLYITESLYKLRRSFLSDGVYNFSVSRPAYS